VHVPAEHGIHLTVQYVREHPMKNTIRLPKSPFYITNELLYRIAFIVFNVIPAFIFDLAGKVFKLKSREMMKLTRQIFVGFKVITDFCKHSIKYDDQNLCQVVSTMTEEDSKIFPCAIRYPIVRDYMKDVVVGMQKFLMKETEEDLRRAKRKMKIFFVVDWIMNAIVFGAVYCISTKVF
jgi:hypothetical protein